MPPEDEAISEQDSQQEQFDQAEQSEQTEQEDLAFDSDESSEDVPGPTSQPAESAPSPAPSSEIAELRARLDSAEARNRDLEGTFRRYIGQQNPQRPAVPEALTKPRNLWTDKDLIEYTQYEIQQGLHRATDEQRARGILSEVTLGKGNDYDSLTQRYLAPLAEQHPEMQPFLQAMGPEDRYMLALMHEVHAHSKGNIVQTIKAIRNALNARAEGARDVVKQINKAAKGAALKVVSGAGGRQTAQQPQTAADVWNMPEDEFQRLANR